MKVEFTFAQPTPSRGSANRLSSSSFFFPMKGLYRFKESVDSGSNSSSGTLLVVSSITQLPAADIQQSQASVSSVFTQLLHALDDLPNLCG
jgi:hypothetical protein